MPRIHPSALAALLLPLALGAPASAQELQNVGFEDGLTSWTHYGFVHEANTLSPIAGTTDVRIGIDPASTGTIEAGIYQSQTALITGRLRAEISYQLEQALPSNVPLQLKMEFFGTAGAGLGQAIYPIANAATEVGTTQRGFLVADTPAGTLQVRFTVLVFRASGTGGGNVRLDDASLASVPPSCGDRLLDTGEQCDNGEKRSDVTPDACRTSCQLAHCGDGVVDGGETCDDGGENSDATVGACRTTCQGYVVADAGTPESDAGTQPPVDAGGADSGLEHTQEDDDGCAIATPRRGDAPSAAWLLPLALLVARRGRRRA